MPVESARPIFGTTRRYYKVVTQSVMKDYSVEDKEELVEVPTIAEADLVSSESHTGAWHLPVFDLDVPAFLLPSSTEDHSHLYINKPCSWRQYKRVLKAMAKAGIIEQKYYKLAKKRGAGHVRAPLLVKPESPKATDPEAQKEAVEAYMRLKEMEAGLSGETEGMTEEEEKEYWADIRAQREHEEAQVRTQPALQGYGASVVVTGSVIKNPYYHLAGRHGGRRPR